MCNEVTSGLMLMDHVCARLRQWRLITSYYIQKEAKTKHVIYPILIALFDFAAISRILVSGKLFGWPVYSRDENPFIYWSSFCLTAAIAGYLEIVSLFCGTYPGEILPWWMTLTNSSCVCHILSYPLNSIH
jgi:hypothetical protein